MESKLEILRHELGQAYATQDATVIEEAEIAYESQKYETESMTDAVDRRPNFGQVAVPPAVYGPARPTAL